MSHTFISTDWGLVGVYYSDLGLRRLTLPAAITEQVKRNQIKSKESYLTEESDLESLKCSLNSYFRGIPVKFGCSLDLSGATYFQKCVWETVLTIPFGEVRSYSWVADELGKPYAYRAIGQALARNPVPIIIPCHRVIYKNGKPGGFNGKASMVDLKIKLLSLEGYQNK